ncbi:MAG: type I-E CRISPR-associated endonuclease Cas1e [Candidatus Kapaibacterium sp.]
MAIQQGNLKDLPKIRDSLSYLYLERGRIEQTKLGIEYITIKGSTLLPVASITTLMLGPGTSITHSAIASLARSGCLVIWSGEEGVRFYAQGMGETRKAYALQRQAALASDPTSRLVVVERMYRTRFKEGIPQKLSIEQLRGMEGARVRDAYAEAAKKYGITWKGRNYNRGKWEESDAPNRALSAANACLNGVCHAAIVSAGYSTGLGFIHQGTQLAFVYDIADLYKAVVTIPIAFATAAENPSALESTVRARCRQGFRNLKILSRIVTDIEKILTVESEILPDGFDLDEDPARPTAWWTPPEKAIHQDTETEDYDSNDS